MIFWGIGCNTLGGHKDQHGTARLQVVTVLWPLHLRKLHLGSHDLAWLQLSSQLFPGLGEHFELSDVGGTTNSKGEFDSNVTSAI